MYVSVYVSVCACVSSVNVVFRCVPDALGLFGNETRSNITRKFFDIIELDDLFRKVLSDIYLCWREMLALCGIAVGMCIYLCFMYIYL